MTPEQEETFLREFREDMARIEHDLRVEHARLVDGIARLEAFQQQGKAA